MIADGAERASNRRWIKVWCCIRISKELGVELHTHRLHSAMGSGTGEKEFVEAEYNIPVQYSDTSKYPACTGANALPVSPFLAAQEKHQESPSSASSQPPTASGNHNGSESSSCQVLRINIGKKYHHQITQDSPDQPLPSATSSETSSTSATTSNPSTPSIFTGGAGGTPSTASTPHPLLASPTQDYKLNPNHDPEIFSLIHAFATPYHYDGTAHPRPHTISIMMANCHVYLMQTPSAVAAEAWIRTVNYWAGLRSREPMRGGISNLEYGWSLLKSPPDSGGGGPREGSVAAAASTDKKVGISAGSEDVLGVESSRSVDSSASPVAKRTNSRPRMQKTNSTDSLKFIGNVLMKRESSAGFAVSFAGDGGSSSISIGASSPAPSIASPVTSGNGNSGSVGSPLIRSMGKSFKLAKWVPEVVSTRLVSNKDEVGHPCSLFDEKSNILSLSHNYLYRLNS